MYRLVREGGGQLVHATIVLGFKAFTQPPPLWNIFDLQSLTPYVETAVAGCWGNRTDNRLSFEQCSFSYTALVASLLGTWMHACLDA